MEESRIEKNDAATKARAELPKVKEKKKKENKTIWVIITDFLFLLLWGC